MDATPTTETGIVEKVAPIIFEAMRWAAMHAENGSPPPWQNGNSTAEYEARKAARAAIAAMPDSIQLLQTMVGALEPFAALARPKTWPDAPGETGPSKLDLIEGEGGTGELYLGTHFGTEKYLTLWRHEFEDALTALAQFRAQEQRS